MSLAGPFKFDPRAFWGDENVKLMTGEQVAAYLKILSLQWEEGDVPADPRRLAVLMTEGARAYTAEDLVGAEGSLEAPLEGSLWAGLKPCFKMADGRMYNERQEKEREDWIRVKDAMSGGGKKGGKRSAKARKQRSKRRRDKASPPSRDGSSPPSSPPSREGSSSSSSSSSSSLTSPDRSHEREAKRESEAAELAALAAEETDSPPRTRARKWDAEVAEIFDHYKTRKLRWYQILQKKPPKEPELTEPDRVAIVARLKDGYSVERLEAALDNVENDAWLMGQTERSKRHQLSLTTVLLVRTNGQVPLNRVEQLLDKTEPDGAMKPMISAVDGRMKLVGR